MIAYKRRVTFGEITFELRAGATAPIRLIGTIQRHQLGLGLVQCLVAIGHQQTQLRVPAHRICLCFKQRNGALWRTRFEQAGVSWFNIFTLGISGVWPRTITIKLIICAIAASPKATGTMPSLEKRGSSKGFSALKFMEKADVAALRSMGMGPEIRPSELPRLQRSHIDHTGLGRREPHIRKPDTVTGHHHFRLHHKRNLLQWFERLKGDIFKSEKRQMLEQTILSSQRP